VRCCVLPTQVSVERLQGGSTAGEVEAEAEAMRPWVNELRCIGRGQHKDDPHTILIQYCTALYSTRKSHEKLQKE